MPDALSGRNWTGCFSEHAAQPSDRGRDFLLLGFFRQRFGRGQHAMRAIGPSREEIVIAALADDRRKRQLLLTAGAFLGGGNPLPFKDSRIACVTRRLKRLEGVARLFLF